METAKVFDEFRQGNEHGLTAVFKQYNRGLLFFAIQYVHTREAAEEIVSDMFIKAWELREQFESMDKLRAFLYVATKNSCLNYLRDNRARPSCDCIDAFNERLCGDGDLLEHVVRTELIGEIFRELEKLPKKQRDVFRMTYMDDLSVEEISEKLKISASAVYTNRSRAAAALRSSLNIPDALLLVLFFLN